MAKLLESILNQILQVQATERIGAELCERTGERQVYRNGYYSRSLVTRVDAIVLRVSRLRNGKLTTDMFLRYQRKAIHQHFQGATWQHCQTHFMRNILARTSKSLRKEIHARVGAILEASGTETARMLLNRF